MMQAVHAPTPPVSPLMLADRLISLAQDADRAGYADSANRLLGLAYAVCDERAAAQVAPRRARAKRG